MSLSKYEVLIVYFKAWKRNLYPLQEIHLLKRKTCFFEMFEIFCKTVFAVYT